MPQATIQFDDNAPVDLPLSLDERRLLPAHR
jgi:hypothetical protein